jgi:hypothetical protein
MNEVNMKYWFSDFKKKIIDFLDELGLFIEEKLMLFFIGILSIFEHLDSFILCPYQKLSKFRYTNKVLYKNDTQQNGNLPSQSSLIYNYLPITEVGRISLTKLIFIPLCSKT